MILRAAGWTVVRLAPAKLWGGWKWSEVDWEEMVVSFSCASPLRDDGGRYI